MRWREREIDAELMALPLWPGGHNVNLVRPERVQSYEGKTVRYSFEWRDKPGVQYAATEIVLIHEYEGDTGDLLPNVDEGSPGGYSWGYGGSGPHALAFSLLAHRTGERPTRHTDFWRGMPRAGLMHSTYTREVTSRWPQGEPWLLTPQEIDAWIARFWDTEEGQEAARVIAEHDQREREWAAEDAAMDLEEDGAS